MAFSVVGDEGPPWMTERIAMGERLSHTGYSAYIVSPLDMAGMIGMAQTWRCAITGIIRLRLDRYSLMDLRLSHPTSLGLAT